MKRYRIAIFASGSGSNAEVICQYFKNHALIEVALILTNNGGAGVLQRARQLNIESFVFNKEDFNQDGKVHKLLLDREITHLVLAGFLWLVPTYLIQLFPNRIINIHPALLPNFGGKGMYGKRVHEAVKDAGEKETGITIHLANEHFDEGKILFQAICPISPTDTPDEIATRVQALEHQHYPPVIERWVTQS
jgi:phosphoribosylglycinamide formyltransferase 1